MRCAECGLVCEQRCKSGGCPFGLIKEQAQIVFTDLNTGPVIVDTESLEEIVKKHAEPPVSREKIERRKKVWKAHEKAVLEPFLGAAQDLVDAVERYVEPKPGQEFVHRSEILLKKNALKKLL